jgi:serine protease Do
MSRRFALVTVVLVATAAFLVGLIVAGSLTPAPANSRTAPPARTAGGARAAMTAPTLVNFADVAEQINPAVVNIDATSRIADDESRERTSPPWESERGDGTPRRGTGSGVIIEPDGHILTNHHVIDRAERILVKLADGRALRAEVVGSDPDTDIALIKISSPQPFPVAPLGNSDGLRVGEWVCAIGNPLAYEHTVTVGVVSYIGRKLFDNSLDDYIQTDAAINFGNSGGPLINVRGEVIGINAAISSRASNIGFAVPVNQARAVLPQLKEHGRVARGFIGVALKDVDPDLQRSLGLGATRGALVQDVTEKSPGERAGLRPYDLITAVDGEPVTSNGELIRRIAATAPGTAVQVDLVRDSRPMSVVVKLAERPGRPADTRESRREPQPTVRPTSGGSPLGLAVRDLDREDIARLELPADVRGVLIVRVDPLGPAFDADLERGQVVLEVNRRAVGSVQEFQQLTGAARAGDVLALYLYLPDQEQRALRTVRIDAP